MRLLDTETCQFVDKNPEDGETVYAILSHTWDGDREQTYEQLKKIQERYRPRSRSSHSSLNIARTGDAPYPKLIRTLPASLGRLAESEVEALLCLVAETFGLTPTPTPSQSDPFAAVHHPHLSTTTLPQSIWDDPELSPKIRNACRVARKNGFRYIWVDSCCIDKSSSSELSEAINSMFKWYSLAAVCYAYLSDVPPGEDCYAEDAAFRKSRWFSRGWTLQELIAPVDVEFLSQNWTPIGSKHALVDVVEGITKVDAKALSHTAPLAAFSIAQRLSWAAKRETTRTEDQAYSLLGIFNINMSPIYGEGERAFQRLQEHIMQRIPDQSLFAWGDLYLPESLPSLDRIPGDYDPITLTGNTLQDLSPSAESPDNFTDSRHIRRVQLPPSHHHEIVYTVTSYGIRTQFQMVPLSSNLLSEVLSLSQVELQLPSTCARRWYLAILGCEHRAQPRHLLGRVCSTLPSEYGVDRMCFGCIDFDKTRTGVPVPDLLLLSPDTLQHYYPYTELKTVYIPHSDGHDTLLWRRRCQPYVAVKLLLLTQTHDALRSRGFSASLRVLDPDHQTTHQLTLRNYEHTAIIIDFQCKLSSRGKAFSLDAEVKLSRSRVPQVRSAPDSDRVDILSWSDSLPWLTELDYQTVQLSTAMTGTLTVELGLAFVGAGVYFLYVDVLSEE